MVGASKILTVSYGTFSCTLEGFDEPFSTMKAIAEYFRDLAADDRYFGAEPPTPDAAMLHKIAEREIKRRVDAQVDDNGVTLRAAEQGTPADSAPKSAQAALTAAQPSQTAAAKAPLAAAPPEDIPQALYEDLPDPTAQGRDRISESVAAKLSRIRSAVDGARASGEKTRPPQNLAALLAASDDSEEADDAEAEALAKLEAETAKAKAEADAKAKQEAEAAKAKAEADAKAKQEAAAAKAKAEADAKAKQEAEAAKAKAEADAKAKQEAAAAKAKAEADAKAKQEAAAAKAKAEADAKAKQDAEAAKAKAEADDAQAAVDDASFDAPDALVSTPEVTTSTEDDDRLIASLTGRFDDEDTAPSARFDDDLEDDTPAPTALSDDDRLMAALAETLSKSDPKADETLPDGPSLEGATAKGKINDTPAALTGEIDDDEDDSDLPTLEDAADEAPESKEPESKERDPSKPAPKAPEAVAQKPARQPVANPAPETEAPKAAELKAEAPKDAPPTAEIAEAEADPKPESLAKAERARARVIKIKRAEPKPPATPKPASHQGASTLSPEAEADLMRELGEVTAEAPKPAKAPENAKPADSAKSAARRDAINGEEESASVSRLIQQTNLEMQGPENRRRLQAISHLKAAVAATEAERKTTGGEARDTEEQRMNPYRSDLERVVRPSKSDGSAPARQGDRPPPLVLVSEQRIDRPKQTATVTPIRPRRVASGNLAVSAVDDTDEAEDETSPEGANIFEGAITFQELVTQIGATDFPDLLEAALAYSHCVEGKESVARPAIMRRLLDHLSDSEDGRETILRHFGQLLRSGRMKKVDRISFALDPTSPVLAEAKAMLARKEAATDA